MCKKTTSSNNKKDFLTIDEQIELLKSRGLNIDNREKLSWYLKNYNYQNFINGYNDFFMINNDRKREKYKVESTSEGIITLFNFDRNISKYILSNIQNIERRLSSSLAYVIAQKMSELGDKTGAIFGCKKEILNKIFTKNFDKNKIKNEILYLEKEPIFKKYPNIDQIPIWSIVVKISFGTLIEILKGLESNLLNKIIKSSGLNIDLSMTKNQKTNIFRDIKNIRNRICHNNVLYNIEIKDDSGMLAFLRKKENEKMRSLRLMDVIEIIDDILNKSSFNVSSRTLKEIINEKIKKMEESNNICTSILNSIKNWINFKE